MLLFDDSGTVYQIVTALLEQPCNNSDYINKVVTSC